MQIFSSSILPSRVSTLLLSEFLLTSLGFLAGCALALQLGTGDYLLNQNGIWAVLVAVGSVLFGLYFNSLYRQTRVTSRVGLALKLCNVFGIALIVQGFLAYVATGLNLPRTAMIEGSALNFAGLLLWRAFYSSVLWKLFGVQRVLFLGTDAVVRDVAEQIVARPERGFGVAGYLSTGEIASEGMPGGEVLGDIGDLIATVARIRPNRIVVGMPDWRNHLPIAELLRLRRQGMEIEDAATVYERVCGRVCARQFRPSQVIFNDELATRPGSVALQSVYTNLLALAGILLTFPLMIVVALAIKMTSRGPAMDPVLCVGLNGIPFVMKRFRCERVRQEGNWAMKEVTPIGHAIRKLHLENLPRLFNLWRGEMALVGPRPERPEFVDVLARRIAYYHQRHSVKPGITGWSQINVDHRKNPVDAMVLLEYDLYYTKHISLALDAYILFHRMRSYLPFS